MKTMFTAAAVAALALAGPVVAQESVSIEVDVSDLDRSNPSDAAELDRRVATAARRVCGSAEARTLAAITRVQTCRADAVSGARRIR